MSQFCALNAKQCHIISKLPVLFCSVTVRLKKNTQYQNVSTYYYRIIFSLKLNMFYKKSDGSTCLVNASISHIFPRSFPAILLTSPPVILTHTRCSYWSLGGHVTQTHTHSYTHTHTMHDSSSWSGSDWQIIQRRHKAFLPPFKLSCQSKRSRAAPQYGAENSPSSPRAFQGTHREHSVKRSLSLCCCKAATLLLCSRHMWRSFLYLVVHKKAK